MILILEYYAPPVGLRKGKFLKKEIIEVSSVDKLEKHLSGYFKGNKKSGHDYVGKAGGVDIKKYPIKGLIVIK